MHTVRLLLILLLLGSTLGGKKKKKKKVKNKNKKWFKKDIGEIYSLNNNYVGVKVAVKSKDELTHSQAEAECKKRFDTSLATIRSQEQQEEIQALLDDKNWGNAVNAVWIGFTVASNGDKSWLPCSNCETDYECSAYSDIVANWHKDAVDWVPLWNKNQDISGCGAIKRAFRLNLYKWDIVRCDEKKEFICNAKAVTLNCEAPTPEPEVSVCGGLAEDDSAFNIAFLLDEGLADLSAANSFVWSIVKDDINDKSQISLFEFKGEDWITYRQTVDFTTYTTWSYWVSKKDQDVTYDDFDTVAVNFAGNVDVLDKVMTMLHDEDVENNADYLFAIVFLDGVNSIDILSGDAADYNVGVGLIFVIIGGECDVTATFPNLKALAAKRYSEWDGQNVFCVDSLESDTEVQAYIHEKVCPDVASSAWHMDGETMGEELIVNGRPSFVGALFGLMVVLVILNAICFAMSVYKKRTNKTRQYEAVDVESSEVSS